MQKMKRGDWFQTKKLKRVQKGLKSSSNVVTEARKLN